MGDVAGLHVATATILTVQAGVAAFAATCPPWWSVRAGGADPDVVRQGVTVAALLVVPAGVLVSSLARSWAPLVTAVAVSGVMAGAYSYALAHPVRGA